jgi:hypothetical protein
MTTRLLWTYLVPAAITSFKVGCRVEGFLRCFSRTTPHPLPAIQPIALHTTDNKSGPIHFDLDSFAMGVDNHALYCMINSPHLFENLTLTGNTRQVNGISTRLAIEGEGTFKFHITDDNGQQHMIRIPNSLYVPKLEKCLLSSQHWAQEAGDNQTKMGNFAHCCILHWGKGFQKTVPFDSTSNALTFFTASSSKAYRAFTSTYEAHEASFFRRETVLTVPGLQLQREAAELDPDKFIAEENLHLKKDGGRETHENITKDDETIKMSNLPQQLSDVPTTPDETVRRGPLTFDPLPTAAEDDDTQVAAADDQAKLCVGSTASAISCSQSSSSLPSMAKFRKSSPRSNHPRVLAASLAH